MPDKERQAARDFVRKLLRRSKGSTPDETNRALVSALFLISDHLAGIENVLCEIESAEARRALSAGDGAAVGACTFCGKLYRMSEREIETAREWKGEGDASLTRCGAENCAGFVAPL